MRTFKGVDNPDPYILLFNSLILSRLEYCAPIWSPDTQVDMKMLEDVQAMFCRRLFTRVNHFYPHLISYLTLLEQLCLPTIESRYRRSLVVSYVLYSCYLVSYPLHTQHPKFLEIASRILLRDKDSIKRLVLIRSSLALAYYNSLPHSLTEHIFSLNFLEYLDEEMCTTSSQSLTLKIRNDLMELNRAVCLDYAQFGIPWFHQKYVRQLRISAQQNSSYSKFHNDVRDVLVHYVGDPQLVLTNVTSPYGQQIDFVLCLDKLGNPVHSHDALTTTSAHRVKTRLAILLEQNWAKGPSELRRRHLELQGYSVINLYNKQWNALFMGEPKAKHLYLDQIFRQYRPLITSGEPL
ncbi:hypothetical protein M8J77_001226 [Diaphorina citri]|nr:hypothetical protein M8J77_001226 [Diaphorina citri]